MVHCSRVRKGIFGVVTRPVANCYPETAEFFGRAHTIFVRHIIANKDRVRSGECIGLHECPHRPGLVGSARNKLNNAFAALDLKIVAVGELLRKREPAFLGAGIGAKMQRCTMRLVFTVNIVGCSEISDPLKNFIGQSVRLITNGKAAGAAAVAAVRACACDRQFAQMPLQINDRPATDKRHAAIETVP